MAIVKLYETVRVRPFKPANHKDAASKANTVGGTITDVNDHNITVFSDELQTRCGNGRVIIPKGQLQVRVLNMSGEPVHKIIVPKPKKAKPKYVPRPLTHKMRIRTGQDDKAARELLKKAEKANKLAIGKEAIKSAVNGLTKEANNAK